MTGVLNFPTVDYIKVAGVFGVGKYNRLEILKADTELICFAIYADLYDVYGDKLRWMAFDGDRFIKLRYSKRTKKFYITDKILKINDDNMEIINKIIKRYLDGQSGEVAINSLQ